MALWSEPPLPSHDAGGASAQVVWVPGSFELPVVAKAMAKSGKFDAVVAIGAVVSTLLLPPPGPQHQALHWAQRRSAP